MVIAIAPIAAMVRAAFSLFGGLNAGTPLEIASTPVNAVQPEANARNVRNASASPVSPTCSGRTCQPALSATGRHPTTARPSPTAIMTITPAMNRYVGTANVRPGLPHPTQVHRHQQQHKPDVDRHPVAGSATAPPR